MLRSLKELYSLLTREQRRKLLKLQGLIIIMSFAEIAGVASIGPFMALVGDTSLLESDGLAASVYQFSGINRTGTSCFGWVSPCWRYWQWRPSFPC